MTLGAARFPLDSPLGPLTLTLSDGAVHGLDFGPSPRISVPPSMAPLLGRVISQLEEYFAGRRRDFDLPLRPDPPGTGFQDAVWGALARIPYGEVLSYADLAAWAGRPGAARAAGSACGANRIALLIPCHRALAKSGLGGFGGGLEAKRWLLGLEARHR